MSSALSLTIPPYPSIPSLTSLQSPKSTGLKSATLPGATAENEMTVGLLWFKFWLPPTSRLYVMAPMVGTVARDTIRRIARGVAE